MRGTGYPTRRGRAEDRASGEAAITGCLAEEAHHQESLNNVAERSCDVAVIRASA